VRNYIRAKVFFQPRQLVASKAARLWDQADGPTAIGYGGARGGGKSHWLLAQMGADDCQRVPGLKCLLLRKVGKANVEHFEDLRRAAREFAERLARRGFEAARRRWNPQPGRLRYWFMAPRRDSRFNEALHEPSCREGRARPLGAPLPDRPARRSGPTKFMVPRRDHRIVEASHEPTRLASRIEVFAPQGRGLG
jgi:hypothetical protein